MKGKLETVNSKTIVENYTNITNDFDDLFLILRNDSSVIDIKRSYYKNVLIMNVVFNVYDGLKPCTFFANGGFRLISGQTSSWYKSENKEDKNLFYSAKEYEWVDSFDGSITSFRPFYGKVNTEMKCGRDVKFFGRLSQTFNVIANEIIRKELYKFDFEEWGKFLGIDCSSRKTHKKFTNKDWFDYLENKATLKGISIISRRTFEGKFCKLFKIIRKMCCAKLNNKTSKFDKLRQSYNEELINTNLLFRIYNPQIRNKNTLCYKIFREVEQGNFATDLTAKRNNKEMFSERQSLLKNLNIVKEAIFSSTKSELKFPMFNFTKNINKMNNNEIADKLSFFENVINNNVELKSILKLKKSKYNTSSFTFNSMCSFSKGFMKKDKNGKLRHYESYASYQNAMNHLKANSMVA